MTDKKSLTDLIGLKKQITTSIGGQAFHYKGEILDVTDSHIIIDDFREGVVSIPLQSSLIRELPNQGGKQ